MRWVYNLCTLNFKLLLSPYINVTSEWIVSELLGINTLSFDQRRYTTPYPLINSCKSNRELQAGMCYNKGRANYHGLVTECWQNCQRGMLECAAVCANSTQSCAMTTLNQVMSVALVANSIYAKFADPYPAMKAASEMSTFERAMADFITALSDFVKNNPQTVTNFESLKQAGS